MYSPSERLRFSAPARPFHVVLLEPEIPPNTGAIARSCAATGSVLHLIEPLGFKVDEHAVRRAGLDYWHLVTVHVHESWDHFRRAFPELVLHFYSAHSNASYIEAPLGPGDALVFGKESVGLPESLLSQFPKTVWSIPTVELGVRSLNLSNAVSIVLFDALHRTGALTNLVAKPE